MPKLQLVQGFDLQGDATLLLQVLDDDNSHIRYASEDELRGFMEEHIQQWHDIPIPEGIGMCQECGAELYPDGECENACRECGDHYADGGDGFDGMCPSCADQAEDEGDEQCDLCGEDNRVIDHTDDDGNDVCTICAREEAHDGPKRTGDSLEPGGAGESQEGASFGADDGDDMR